MGSNESLSRDPMTIFQDKLLTRTYCDEAGDHAVPNVLSPWNRLIGHKLDHHHRLDGHTFFNIIFRIFRSKSVLISLTSRHTPLQFRPPQPRPPPPPPILYSKTSVKTGIHYFSFSFKNLYTCNFTDRAQSTKMHVLVYLPRL